MLTNEKEKLSEDRTKKIIHQILTGLRYLHSKNIFHGHITPQCIVYSDYDRGAIKITGFGYHTLLDRELTDDHEKYFHPADKFANGEFYGPLTDIWSVGCLMYFMLSGKGLTRLGKD